MRCSRRCGGELRARRGPLQGRVLRAEPSSRDRRRLAVNGDPHGPRRIVRMRRWPRCGPRHPGSRSSDATAAKRFFKRLLQGLRYRPRRLITDGLRSYGVAHREILPDVRHHEPVSE